VLFLGIGVLFFWIIISIIFGGYTAWGLAVGGSIDYAIFSDITLGTFLVGIGPILLLFFFVSSGEKANKVPGAIDNLSAVAVVLGLGRYLKKHKDVIPDGTEIRLISFGCEEAGLRGAYRYAAAHHDELKALDAEVVNMDGVQSVKNVLVIANEPTTRTTHSKEVVEKILRAAESNGIKAKVMGTTFIEKLIGLISGGTDAAAFSKAGIKAANMMQIDFRKFLKFYHQPTDRVDMISEGALEMAVKICIGYVANLKNSST
jgi:Zn-dependent M28 family amino/carboxypeptidase